MVVEPGQDLTTTFPTSHTGHQGVPSSGGGGGEPTSTQEPSGGGVPLGGGGGGEHHGGQQTPSHHHQYSSSNAQNPLYMTRKSFLSHYAKKFAFQNTSRLGFLALYQKLKDKLEQTSYFRMLTHMEIIYNPGTLIHAPVTSLLASLNNSTSPPL